jgi:hypothetical protein
VRAALADGALQRAVAGAFDLSRADVWIAGRQGHLSARGFNAKLSELCDSTYSKGIRVWNEQINRRELTSAGARARRELIDAMAKNADKPRLGLVGDGPESSIYDTVLRDTGIHTDLSGRWGFNPPTDPGIAPLWTAIEEYCLGARDEPRSLDSLLRELEAPPYGIKTGIVPVLLAAVLEYHADDLSVYYLGTFLPVLGPEQWEVLVRHPQNFAVKHFELTGVRWKVFRELEDVVRSPAKGTSTASSLTRNATLLSVVRPLIRFVMRLPEYTKRTNTLSQTASGVRDLLRSVREPDDLLFRLLPEAVGLTLAESDAETATDAAGAYRKTLLAALRELDGAYDRLLGSCRDLLCSAFGVVDDPTRIRVELTVRGQHLVGRVIDPSLKSVVHALVNDAASDREWLEALIMVISDKPADSWSDDDALAFEFKAADAARRFRSLWLLVHEAADARRDEADARRISLTRPNGSEYHDVVWIDRNSRESIESVVREVMSHVAALPREHQLAVAAAFTEAVFESARKAIPTVVAAGSEDRVQSHRHRESR